MCVCVCVCVRERERERERKKRERVSHLVGVQETCSQPGCLCVTCTLLGGAGPRCLDPTTSLTVAAALVSASSAEIAPRSRGSSISRSDDCCGVRLRARMGVADDEGVGEGVKWSW